MTYDVRLTILGGVAADAPVYRTEVLMQMSDQAYNTLAQFSTPSIDPKASAPSQPWVLVTSSILLDAIQLGRLDLPDIKPEIFQYLQLVSLVEPGKIGISVDPSPAADLSETSTLTAS